MNFFATTPKGLELLLVEELRALGAETAAEKLAGVVFTGELSVAYKACLWSRLANRILLPLTKVPASTPEELYAGVQMIAWDEHMLPDATLHIHFVTSQSEMTHTLYGAQKVKDAIVDQFRKKYNTRPNVARENPDLSVHVYLHRNIAQISIDLSGESLHKRGIRVEHGSAPLKENLAAAILMRAGWKSIAASGGMLIDPMCGSGTFLIEAAQMAGNIAPGLSREYFGFLGWKQHDIELWNILLDEAKEQQTLEMIPDIVGYDADPRAIKIAFANIERADMLGKIHVEKRDISSLMPKDQEQPGLVVMNPPYGERLGEESELPRLYEQVGAKLKNDFSEWKAAIFTGNPELGKNMGIRARKHYALFNGAIPCQLLLFDIDPQWFIDRSPAASNKRRIVRAQRMLDESDLHAMQMFTNRLSKNKKHLKRWAERDNVTAYRLYDADLPEYAVSIDLYNDSIVVKEYPAPKSIDKIKAERRLQHVLAVLPEALNMPEDNIFFHHYKISNPDVSLEQIKNDFYPIKENELNYIINLRYENFETGLPLHQRLLRSYIQNTAAGKHFLNLGSRAGAATVAAAAGGALTTTNIDENEVFLEWSRQNLELNHFSGSGYKFIHADPIEWADKQRQRFDFIYAELPESSHRLRDDYLLYIKNIIRILKPDGQLLLTSRDQRFKLDSIENIKIEELTQRLISPDFSRQPRMCRCVKITYT
jgi:23S rRNA (guanine2445-N2)-methyltransferase / 23S rRNA (guanine2069-N7)-methyltransferase